MAGEPEPEPGDPGEDIDGDESKKSEEEYESEAEEISDSTIKSTYESESDEVSEAKEKVKRIQGDINIASDTNMEMDALDATYDRDGSEDAGSNDARRDIDDLRQKARDYREEEVGTQSRKGRLYTRAKGLSLLLGIMGTTVGLSSLILAIVLAVKNSAQGTPNPPDDGLTEEQRKLILSEVERWRGLSDGKLWDAVAVYCDSWNPSWQAQILMMDTIKKLAVPLSPAWVWRGSDAATYARMLVNAYAGFVPGTGQRRSRILYTTVSGLTYDLAGDGKTQVALPRQIAADLCELAAVDIVTREHA